MEATDIADALRGVVGQILAERSNFVESVETSAGYEEADFFVEVGGERFLVAVMKVSE